MAACSACDSKYVRVLRHSERWNFDVARCQDCGTAFALDERTPEEVEGRYDNDLQDQYEAMMREPEHVYESVLGELGRRIDSPDPLLFDVGAGVGAFLAKARESGFRIAGNELSQQQADYALREHGVEINVLPLSDQEPESVDALTMWCIIAHVRDPKTFLVDALQMLKPGGVLFLRTPRWSSVDNLGVAASKASGGRIPDASDFRVTPAHLHLLTDAGLRAVLERAGFEAIEVIPVTHFGFNSGAYVDLAPTLRPLAKATAATVEALIARDRFLKNAIFAYARRPA